MGNEVSELKNSIKNWWVYEVLGFIMLIISAFIFTYQRMAYENFVSFFIMTFIVSGLLKIFFSVTNRESLGDWGWYLGGGVFDLVFGFLLASIPATSTVIVAYYVAFFLMFSSISSIGHAMDVKAFKMSDWFALIVVGVTGLFFSVLILLRPTMELRPLIFSTAMAFLCIGAYNLYLGFSFRKVNRKYFANNRLRYD